MARGFILGKFFPPHMGHWRLIEFAMSYFSGPLQIIVSGNDSDFIHPKDRAVAIGHRLGNSRTYYARGGDTKAVWFTTPMPQYPEDTPDFWEQWHNFMRTCGFEKGDYLFASEKYGVKLAEGLDGIFVPFDLYRTAEQISGTAVRYGIEQNFVFERAIPEMLPELNRLFPRRVFTLFGAESTGKTSLRRYLQTLNSASSSSVDQKIFDCFDEYARGYLDAKEILEPTQKHMREIHAGQLAFQKMARNPNGAYLRAIAIQDTDLFTTAGYWDIFGFPLNAEYQKLLTDARKWKSDHYFVMDDEIPFVQDHQRYGDGVRQTDTKYWTNILDRENLPYTIISGEDRQSLPKIITETYKRSI